jgi:membrane-bound serine protease (ClpP class)
MPGIRSPHPLRRAAVASLALGLALTLAAAGEGPDEPAAPAVAGAPEVLVIRIDGAIQPVIAEFVADAVAEADETGAAALIVELSTPGGLTTSTREITTALLGAARPVIVYVAPDGAQAASAGFFILMAADVAAMAPGTNTGAAHPVGGQGEDIPGTMGKKVEQDAAANIRSLAERHGRNAKLAEEAVVESRSFSAEEALAAELIDLVAPSLQKLLVDLDGREVMKGNATVKLATADARVRTLEMSPMRRFLSVIAHPNIASILVTLGVLGLTVEVMNPGAVLPGVLGAICLILGFFALSVLPFSYAGLALIALAVVFFIAEIKVTSYGMLSVAGIVSLVFGLLLLFKSPEPALRVSLDLVIGLALFAALVVGSLTALVVRARRGRVHTGSQGMVGEVGRSFAPLAPRGQVFVHGEIWNAVCARPVAAGQRIEVVAVDGLLLTVRPLDEPAPAPVASAASEPMQSS